LSDVSGRLGTTPSHNALGAEPFGGSISCRFEASTLTSTPFSGIVSPGFPTISFAPLAAIAARNVAIIVSAPLPVSVVGPCVITFRNFTRDASCSMPPT
jgi:hypothetical protein